MSDSFCFISPVKFCLPCRACCCWSCRFYQPVISCFLLDLLWLSGYCTSPVWDTVSSLVLYSLYVINNIKLKGKLSDKRVSQMHLNCGVLWQECIYAANEYPAFARTMSISSRKLKISHKISWIGNKSVCFGRKQTNLKVKHTESSIIQHCTVGSQKFNTLILGWWGPLNTPCS